ncbi:hypothetical protein D1007_36456 [Hordeum vulgare]|nr:hypothetical protein D1007_36456 [Hordeum vulgare]
MDYMEEENHVSLVKLNSKTENIISRGSAFAHVVRTSPQGINTGVALEELETGNASYRVESPESSLGTEVIPTPLLATEENLRFSLRNVQSKMENVQVKAATAAKKRDIEGNTHIPNSFDALSNPEMMLAAIKMGFHIPDADFANIDVIRELEKFRNNNSKDERVEIVDVEGGTGDMDFINANGQPTPLDLNWSEENNGEEEEYTVVRSRKKNKRKKIYYDS